LARVRAGACRRNASPPASSSALSRAGPRAAPTSNALAALRGARQRRNEPKPRRKIAALGGAARFRVLDCAAIPLALRRAITPGGAPDVRRCAIEQ